MKDMDGASFVLGIKIVRDREKQRNLVSHKKLT